MSIKKIFKFYLFFGERGGREKEQERNINVWQKCRSAASRKPCPGPQPRHVPWVRIWRPFGLQASAQPTEPYQPGKIMSIFNGILCFKTLQFLKVYSSLLIDKTWFKFLQKSCPVFICLAGMFWGCSVCWWGGWPSGNVRLCYLPIRQR